MSLKLSVFAFAASLLLSPVHAEEGEAGAVQAVAPSPVEERIRAYRQRFDRREVQDEQRLAEFERRREESSKRHVAMQKYYSEKMQARLTMIEERQQQIAARHEAGRNRAQDRYNYLSSNSEDLMNKALDAQLEIAERHEEIRTQAEERHKKIAAHRDAMMSMTMEERRAYMDEHANEIFGSRGETRRPAAPQRPPWAMRRPSRPAYGPVPRGPRVPQARPAPESNQQEQSGS